MRTINSLPSKCGEVFRLSRFDGLSNEDIARQLGISIDTVKYHIKHALMLLNQHLSQYLTMLLLIFFRKHEKTKLPPTLGAFLSSRT